MPEREHDSYAFPTDLADDPDGGALRWTVTVIVLAAALLALLNAQAIRGWAEELPPGPGVLPLVAASETWDETMAEIGLGTGHARLHRTWKRLESARWTSHGPAVEEARR